VTKKVVGVFVRFRAPLPELDIMSLYREDILELDEAFSAAIARLVWFSNGRLI
jgi:hypothetical protein